MKNLCAWENCFEIGEYKAPIEKDNSRKYRLLCLEHIKIFNKKWNYFENMNNDEVEFFINSERAVRTLRRCVKHASERGRQDLVDKYTLKMAQLVKNVSYVESLRGLND